MIIVGERINTSRKAMAPAVENRDVEFIQNDAKAQVAAGANFVDVNCGTFIDHEPELLEWLVKTVQEVVDVPLSLDSPRPAALERAYAVHKGQPLVNSITAEKVRLENQLPFIRDHKTKVIALCMDDDGMPTTAEKRIAVASRLVEILTGDGIPLSDIYIDPLICPISTDSEYGNMVLRTICEVKGRFPGVQTICGLSNVSYGLPQRKLINQAFLVLCIGAGLDAAIIDPLDNRLMQLLLASEALIGRDEFCMNYLTAAREGRLEVQ